MQPAPLSYTSGGLQTPFRKESVVKQIIHKVEHDLLHRVLKPGDRFPSESELCKTLGVSKSSVREAVKILEALGVLDVRQGEGTFVNKSPGAETINPLLFSLLLMQDDASDIISLRAMFEPAFCVMAMQRATQEDIRHIQAAVDAFEQAIADGTQTGDMDMHFHRELLYATHNPYVIRIGEMVLALFSASIDRAVARIPETSLRDHKAILNAFLAKDEALLREEILKSYQGWTSAIQAAEGE